MLLDMVLVKVCSQFSIVQVSGLWYCWRDLTHIWCGESWQLSLSLSRSLRPVALWHCQGKSARIPGTLRVMSVLITWFQPWGLGFYLFLADLNFTIPLPTYTAAPAATPAPKKMVSILLLLLSKLSGWLGMWMLTGTRPGSCHGRCLPSMDQQRSPDRVWPPTRAGLDVWVPSRSLSLSAIPSEGIVRCADVWPLAEHQGRIFPLVAACSYPSQ